MSKPTLRVSMFASAGAVSLATISLILAGKGSTNWGDVPTWVGAIGTTLAVVVALLVAYSETRQRKALAHRHQADSVTAWVVNPRGPRATGGTFTAPSEWVALLNSSDAVVYDVVVSLRFKVRGQERPVPTFVFARFLPPGEWFTRLRSPLDDSGDPIATDVAENASIAFTDTHGTYWRRDSSGTLNELGQSALTEHGGRDNINFNWLTGEIPSK